MDKSLIKDEQPKLTANYCWKITFETDGNIWGCNENVSSWKENNENSSNRTELMPKGWMPDVCCSVNENKLNFNPWM